MPPKKPKKEVVPVPVIPDRTSFPTLWQRATENTGPPLAGYEKEELLQQIEMADLLWKATVEKILMAATIAATQAEVVKACLEEVEPSQAMKKALTKKSQDLPADEWLSVYLPGYVEHQMKAQEESMVTHITLPPAEVEAMAATKLQPPQRPEYPGWNIACAWSGAPLRKRHTLERELEIHSISPELLQKARKTYVASVLPKCLKDGGTNDALLAAHMYTREDPELFKTVNPALRAEDKNSLDKLQVTISNLLLALVCLPGCQAGGLLYRGQDRLYGKELAVGGSMTWQAFASVTTEESVAKSFAATLCGISPTAPGGVLFVLSGVPPSVGGCLEELSEFPNEGELLLPPGMTFVLKKERTDGKLRVLELEFAGVHPAGCAAALALNSPLEAVPGIYLSSERAWPALCNALQPFCNPQIAIDLIDMNPESLSPKINTTVPGMQGPPLWAAARNQDSVPLLEGLVTLGADVKELAASGSTALHMAAYYGHTACVKYLLEVDPSRKATSALRDNHNHTALEMGQRHPEVIAAFKAFGIEQVADQTKDSDEARTTICEPDIQARDICGRIGLIPSPRSYDAELYRQGSPNRTRP